MKRIAPNISVTRNALVIRIPWETFRESRSTRLLRRRLDVKDILQLVGEGRRAHRLGHTRVISSLRALMS
jgi:hypothetical protein